jgi:outer membrane cobalamin receptor
MSMRARIPATATALVLWAFAASAASAQTAVDTVVVTATRSSIPLAKVPESVSIVTAAEIQNTPARSIDEVLRAVPSVNLPAMASYELFPNLSTVSMRGLGGSRALVLLDGVPLNDPFFGFVQWSFIPLADVDHVEVVRGGGAALWGNYAMGGVIDVQTKVPDQQKFVLDAAGGSYGTVRANGYAAFKVSDHFQFDIDAATTKSDGYDATAPASRVPLTVPDRFKADNLQTDLKFEIDPTLTGSLRAGYHDFNQTLHTPVNQNRQVETNLSGDLVKTLGDSTLTGTLFHIDSRFKAANSDTPPGGVPGVVEYAQNFHITPTTSDGGSLVWSRTSDGWLRLLSAGGDYQQLHGSDVGYIYSAPQTPLRIDQASGNQRFAGLFAQAEAAPIDHLQILASGRYQYFENYDGFNGAPGGGGAQPTKSTSRFDPRVSAHYDLTPIFALRAAAYEAFHAPTINSLYRSFSNRFGIFDSNSALRPETLTGGEAGFDVTLPGVRAQVTYYDNTIDNLLTTRPLLHSQLPPGFHFGTLNINAGSAQAQGVEAEIDWKLSQRLSATFAYAYADSIMKSNAADPTSVGKQLGGVPAHTGSAQLAYTGAAGWKVAGRLYWHDAFYSDNDHTLPIGSQTTVDVSASYPIGSHFEPYVQIENLFGEQHIADNAGTSAPQLETPFTAMVGLRVRFN